MTGVRVWFGRTKVETSAYNLTCVVANCVSFHLDWFWNHLGLRLHECGQWRWLILSTTWYWPCLLRLLACWLTHEQLTSNHDSKWTCFFIRWICLLCQYISPRMISVWNINFKWPMGVCYGGAHILSLILICPFFFWHIASNINYHVCMNMVNGVGSYFPQLDMVTIQWYYHTYLYCGHVCFSCLRAD